MSDGGLRNNSANTGIIFLGFRLSVASQDVFTISTRFSVGVELKYRDNLNCTFILNLGVVQNPE
jgi:hypothetical protein